MEKIVRSKYYPFSSLSNAAQHILIKNPHSTVVESLTVSWCRT